jgi:FkbM family methyltransferase
MPFISLAKRISRRLGRVLHPEAKLSFSQEGEDLVLLRTLEMNSGRSGFYVDVGAHSPKWYSNTFLLYQQGWRGINIDATSGVARKFARVRPADTTLEVVVGNGDTKEFIDFEGHALSGLASKQMSERIEQGVAVKSRRIVKTVPLSAILESHMSPAQKIDLLTIDVEGHEEEVLKSNDWNRYRPRVIIVEIGHAVSMADVLSAPVTLFLGGLSYIPYARTGLSVFFSRKECLKQSRFGFSIEDDS